METFSNISPRDFNENPRVLLFGSSNNNNNNNKEILLLLDNIILERPLIFTLPILPILKEPHLKDEITKKNYIVKEYKNLIVGLRADFEVFGGDFEKVFTILTLKDSITSLKEYIDFVLNRTRDIDSPFSKEDEIEILDPLFF